MKPLPPIMFLVNVADAAEREVRAADAGHHAAEQHVAVAQPQHLDADRVGRGRVLADRPGAQAPPGAEQRRRG